MWRGETSFTIRHPWVVAFAFGLLHGFGFASAMTSAGLPRQELPLALLSFNVGVEDRAARFRRPGPGAGAFVPRARGPLAALGAGASRLHRRLAGRVLDDPASGLADRGVAMTPAPKHRSTRGRHARGALGAVGPRPRPAGRSLRICHRLPASDLGLGPRPRDGRRRAVGRAARRTRDLGVAGGVSAGHGDGRHARISRRADPRRGIRDRRFGDRARRRGGLRSCGRRWSSRRLSSGASRSSTAMRTAPNSRPARARCSTAWAS